MLHYKILLGNSCHWRRK